MLALLAGCSPGAVELDAAAPEGPAAEACAALVEALPDRVADLERRDVEPEGALGAAWGDPPIVLTCDDERPEGYGPTSACTTVNGIDWYLPEEEVAVDEVSDVTMTVLNREAYVRVELPAEHWPPAETMVDVAGAVAETLEPTGRCK